MLRLSVVLVLSAVASNGSRAAVDASMTAYSRPATKVQVGGGRTLNITCMGRGSPTVVLGAGLGEWSETWRLVQPAVARTTRVCAWDRAGVGFSDASDRPQTIRETVADLAKALRASNLIGPLVLVGHSLGGLEMLLFADRHPGQVRGMVLVDPSIPDQIAQLHRAAPAFAPLIDEANETRSAHLRRCAAAAAHGKLRLGAPDPESCLSYPAYYPKPLAAKLARSDMGEARWKTALSLSENFQADARLAINPKRNYGTIPFIVLSSTRVPSAPPDAGKAVADDAPRLLRELVQAHDELATLSSTGRNVSVPDTGHYIQVERPAAVIGAIREVIGSARRIEVDARPQARTSARRRHSRT